MRSNMSWVRFWLTWAFDWLLSFSRLFLSKLYSITDISFRIWWSWSIVPAFISCLQPILTLTTHCDSSLMAECLLGWFSRFCWIEGRNRNAKSSSAWPLTILSRLLLLVQKTSQHWCLMDESLALRPFPWELVKMVSSPFQWTTSPISLPSRRLHLFR